MLFETNGGFESTILRAVKSGTGAVYATMPYMQSLFDEQRTLNGATEEPIFILLLFGP